VIEQQIMRELRLTLNKANKLLETLDRLRICQECSQEFVAQRHDLGKYCSTRCNSKVTSRRYYQRQHDVLAERRVD